MKLIKPMILTLALITLLPVFVNKAHADYYQLNVKYWCGWQYVTAEYKYRSLHKARIYQNVFRRIPKYRNCWIRRVS